MPTQRCRLPVPVALKHAPDQRFGSRSIGVQHRHFATVPAQLRFRTHATGLQRGNSTKWISNVRRPAVTHRLAKMGRHGLAKLCSSWRMAHR